METFSWPMPMAEWLGKLTLPTKMWKGLMAFLHCSTQRAILFGKALITLIDPNTIVHSHFLGLDLMEIFGLHLPERCGKFGVCEDSQCVACPLPYGLMGWNKSCEPQKLTSC
ncbi:unnamed protein product, partial [Prunus brigantina]